MRRVRWAAPQPCVATYAPPGSLKRWLKVTEPAVAESDEARELVGTLRYLTRRLEQTWIPASELVVQAIHGDVRLSNVVQTPDLDTVYLDFGFSALRPRVYDVAYAMVFAYWALNSGQDPGQFDWSHGVAWLHSYEEAAQIRLTTKERRALVPMMASVPLYAAALDGYTEDPVGKLLGRKPFVELSAWLLAHSDVL